MKKGIEQPVLVRTYSAGVHFGYLKSREGKEVILVRSRRIWNWKGANTLNEIALRGVGVGSKVSERSARLLLTEVIEIHDCSKEATANLELASWG